jgi:Mg2+-importing ATPase
LPAEAVLKLLGSGSEGLTTVDAADRLRALGANVLLTHRVTALGVLKRQLRNPLLFLLLGAAVISGLTGDPADAVIIAAILALSVGLGFVNEYRSERAAVALHDNIRHQTQVRRDDAERRVDVRELVPGTSSRWASGTSSRLTSDCWRRRGSSATRRCLRASRCRLRSRA